MSKRKQQIGQVRGIRQILLGLLFALGVPLFAETSQPVEQLTSEQIKAELKALRRELATLQAQPAEPVAAATVGEVDFFELSLEELMNVEVETAATLTRTTRRLTPFAMTTITQEDIERSQARSLYELLEMYVPNLQMLFAREHPKALGLRGIISHRSDKFLLLVNGRIMNERTDFGVMTEVDLPMLTDIHHIEVVRGPSSALYGPGALSMTINIVTENSDTFQGNQVTVSGGGVEEFATLEYKHGRKIDEDSGVYFYAGVSKYDGATANDSPTVFGSAEDVWLQRSYPAWNWAIFDGREYVGEWFKNLNQTPFDRPKMKLYAQYQNEGFEIWGRYTEGGQWIDFLNWRDYPLWLWDEDSDWYHSRLFSDEGLYYTQATVQASYKHEWSSDLSIKYTLSFDEFTNENENFERAYLRKSFAEDEIYGSVVAKWNPRENHSVAFGAEWSHEEFGKPLNGEAISDQPFEFHYPPNKTDPDPHNWIGYMPRWSTDHPAVFGEYQWNINKMFTLFLSSRLDWHTYTKSMFSPRAVLVITPSEKDTVKLMASRSSRQNTAAQMWIDYEYLGMKSPVEKLNAFELRYERQHTDNLWFAGSGFMYRMKDALGAVPEAVYGTTTGTKVIGDLEWWGVEAEASYRSDKWRVDLSHSYTKLSEFRNLTPGVTWNNFSAEPYGEGDDFSHWYNQTTKLRAEYRFSDKLAVNGALCVLWDNPGGKDQAVYRNSQFANWDYDVSFEKPFETNVYLNMGVEYKLNENAILRFTGYNLMGLIDKDLNKRRIGFDREFPGRYRVQPVAFSGSLTYKF